MSDLTMARGDTPSFDLDINNPDGSPYNLTGATIKMTALRHKDDPKYRALFSKTSAGGSPTIVITNAAGGIARVDMVAADTRYIEVPAALFYDVEITNGAVTFTPITGTLTISPDASR